MGPANYDLNPTEQSAILDTWEDRFDAYLEAEGVDVALLMSEYSPRVTGIQPVEDLQPSAAGVGQLIQTSDHQLIAVADEIEDRLQHSALVAAGSGGFFRADHMAPDRLQLRRFHSRSGVT